MSNRVCVSKKIFVSACEPSSNLHLSFLAPYFDDSWQVCGVFEENIFTHFSHATPSYTLKDFAVMGFFDVLKKLRFYKRVVREMKELAMSCDCVLLMDSSSFNLPIAKALKKAGAQVPVIYYILPQVWAWKPWRAKLIESVCDELCAILPFEIAMYPQAYKQGRIHYVGHPLLDEINDFKLQPTPMNEGKIAFMPGSRKSEIKRIFPIFAQVAQELKSSEKILVLPEHFKSLSADELIHLYGAEIEAFEISFNANEALMQSHFAFVCSGTATLQAVLIGTPLVLGYKARSIEVAIARVFVKLKHIGLANIFYNAMHFGSPKIGKKHIHIELIQDELTKEKLLEAYKAGSKELLSFFEKVKEVRTYLGHGAAKQVAERIRIRLESKEKCL